jgi:hypothetical protein
MIPNYNKRGEEYHSRDDDFIIGTDAPFDGRFHWVADEEGEGAQGDVCLAEDQHVFLELLHHEPVPGAVEVEVLVGEVLSAEHAREHGGDVVPADRQLDPRVR